MFVSEGATLVSEGTTQPTLVSKGTTLVSEGTTQPTLVRDVGTWADPLFGGSAYPGPEKLRGVDGNFEALGEEL